MACGLRRQLLAEGIAWRIRNLLEYVTRQGDAERIWQRGVHVVDPATFEA